MRPEPDMPVTTTTSGTRAALSRARICWPASLMELPSRLFEYTPRRTARRAPGRYSPTATTLASPRYSCGTSPAVRICAEAKGAKLTRLVRPNLLASEST